MYGYGNHEERGQGRGRDGSGHSGGSRRYSSSARTDGFGRHGGEVRPRSGTSSDLLEMLRSIDHCGYPAYKKLTGRYTFRDYTLSIDHVQGDPFAAPSSVSIHINGRRAGFPERMWKNYENRRALADHLIRLFARQADAYSKRAGGSGKSGLITCSHPGQEVLERSACQVDPLSGGIVFRLYVGFPAAGRTVLAGGLEKILFDFLPAVTEKSLLYGNLDRQRLESVIDLAEDQTFLRKKMQELGLVAFVADGSVLPRESGVSQRPMTGAVPFISPEEDASIVTLPHKGKIRGMGIPAGITLIIGGGYHGKSTLLKALERGVYDHISGDGREFVLTEPTAVKVRAEDGRFVSGVDISPFIRNLPSGSDTCAFSTEDASGSTSQAAYVTEAVESGARTLLMDEDTCAANFMVRDELMRKVVSPEEEPIVPYSETMRTLFDSVGVSTILVAGSSGGFFPAADRILQMKDYVLHDVTAEVRKLVPATGTHEQPGTDPFSWDSSVRKPSASSAFSGRVKLKSLGRDGFMIGHVNVDLRAVEQIVDGEQSECLAQMLLLLSEKMNGRLSLTDLIESIEDEIRAHGISAAASGRLPGNLAMPRIQELYAAVNRCRAVVMRQ